MSHGIIKMEVGEYTKSEELWLYSKDQLNTFGDIFFFENASLLN